MGDYTKLIVNCGLKKMTKQEIEVFRKTIEDGIGICTSAYHCGGEGLYLDDEWHHRTDMLFVTQAKYGSGIKEFIDWLRPYVTDGFGESEMFAFEISEYCDKPKIYTLDRDSSGKS